MQAKKDTLFSIKNDELRKRKFSLLAMRLTFIMAFFNIFPLVSDILHKEYLQQIIAPFLWIGIICLMLLAMNYLYFLSFFIIAAFMVYVKWYTITYDFVLPYVEEVLCVCSIFSVIPAWKVCSSLRKQKVKVKKDTLFSIKNRKVKKERKLSLLVLRVLFILESLVSLFILFVLSYFFSDTTFSNALLSTYGEYMPLTLGVNVTLSLLELWFLWKLQFWSYYTIGVICFIMPLYNIFISLDAPFRSMIFPLVEQSALLITSLRVHSFLRKQAKEPFTQDTDEDNTSEFVFTDLLDADISRYLFLFLLNAGIFIFCIQKMEFRFAELFTVRFSIASASFIYGICNLGMAVQEVVAWYKDE